MSNSKIHPLEALEAKMASLKGQGRKVVLCHGTFDLMHAGHIKYLQRAAQEGDVLVVTITADEYVNKGPGRPVFTSSLRAESIAALECVDYVAENCQPTAINVIQLIKPDLYVKGGEYRDFESDVTGNIAREVSAVKKCGGDVFFTDEITFSSTSLINEHFGIYPDSTKRYLAEFRQQNSVGNVIDFLKSLAGLKVLVVGDAIVDEYHYTKTLGQTGKGNVLAVKHESEEQFAGGSLAVASHISGFAGEVTLVAGLGGLNSHEGFIRSKLEKNIKPVFFYREDGQTLVKRRFVDEDMAKLFEVYFYNDAPLPGSIENDVCEWLDENIDDYDAVIVPDFGNGFISPRMADVMSEKARFLVVNTQVNSGNRGYHVIGRYPKVDFVSLNEPELRLAAHDKNSPLNVVADKIADQVGARWVAVTRGTKGLLMVGKMGEEDAKVPPLSTRVVDRIGAGDAFLSLAGICLAAGAPTSLASFIGSAAAALEVQTVCNREPVDFVQLSKFITTLLK